jgi:hypothetical protein
MSSSVQGAPCQWPVGDGDRRCEKPSVGRLDAVRPEDDAMITGGIPVCHEHLDEQT